MELQELKEVRNKAIDEVTELMIRKGFSFALFQGELFSMSDSAQINWSNFPNLPDTVFNVSGCLPVMSKNEVVCLLPLAHKMNFYYSALNHKNTYLQSGSVLKGQINSAQTEEEVQAVEDNRYTG